MMSIGRKCSRPSAFINYLYSKKSWDDFFFRYFAIHCFQASVTNFKALQSIPKKLNVDFCCIEAEAK